MEEQRLAYLQWVLKTERTPLLDEFVHRSNKDFDKLENIIAGWWSRFKAESEAKEKAEAEAKAKKEVEEKEKARAPLEAGAGEPQKWQPEEFGPDTDAAAAKAPEFFQPAHDSSTQEPAPAIQPPATPIQPATKTAHAPAEAKPAAPAATNPMPLPPSPALRFSVKNARQGETFGAEIMIEPRTAKPVLCAIRFPEDLPGLVAEPPHWRIDGVPRGSGEFALRVEYRDTEGAPIRTGTLHFVVNPDPRTLWEDKPSDPSTGFWKEDDAYSMAPGSEAKIVAARRRGRSHAHKGSCCDDDYVIESCHGWYMAIVADGAGSAKFARRGSQVATRRAADFMQRILAGSDGDKLWRASENYANAGAQDPETAEGQTLRNSLYVTLGHAAHAAARALQEEATARDDIIANIRELSTTLLIGLARKIGTRWFCAAYWVGDGAVGVYRQNKEVILLGVPDSGEFSGQTRFLTAEEVQQESLLRRLRFTVVEDMTAFMLMTDGVSDPKFPSEIQLGRLAEWDALWQDIETGASLREGGDVAARLHGWLNFWASGEYDDRTLAIIY
ncbi:MAG: protein phosphatase 2C domain-containing protein [Azoarcus sp.]|nr:protein phosphatase 2C domain-containing protein [Azoarcus sp.]